MAGRDSPSQTAARLGAEPPAPSAGALEIFISYRHADTGAHALLLRDRLERRFGADDVFLDVAALRAGMEWRREIHARADACGALLVLIGRQWLTMLKESSQRTLVEGSDDVARQEVELALAAGRGIAVVPVLVDDAAMPAAHELPRSLRALADRQFVPLRLESYEDDVRRLMAHLEGLGRDSEPEPATDGRAPADPAPPTAQPAALHHRRVASLLAGAGHVVAVLGPGVNAGCEPLPNADMLAADLARRFSYEPESRPLRLAEVAEYVDLAWGRPDLHLSVKQDLDVDFKPTAVHEFFARIPRSLEARGRQRRHQLILTTNYDNALERAFEDAHEPVDLAVYAASMRRFVHVPWHGDPKPVAEPNRYYGFPIGDDLELTRSVIVKLHGAVAPHDLPYGGEDDYVITEDNYINYLSGSSVEQIVPFQILQKLRSSHCLFLGYDVANWNLRVILKRVWGARIRAASWAIKERPNDFERVLWRECGPELVAEPLLDYVEAVAACLAAER